MRALAIALVAAILLSTAPAQGATPARTPVSHVVVVMEENHSFDNLFAGYPGVPVPPLMHYNRTNTVYEDQAIDGFVGHPGSYAYYGQNYLWTLASEGVLFDDYHALPLPTLPNHLALVAGWDCGETHDFGYYGNYSNWPFFDCGPTVISQLVSAGLSWSYWAAVTGADVDNEYPLNFIQGIPPTYLGFHNLAFSWESQTLTATLSRGNLSAVTYLVPPLDMHPPDSLDGAMAWLQSFVTALEASPAWPTTALVVTFDESGGWYDSASTPVVNGTQLGYRVPTILLSGAPGLKTGYDHTLSSHASVLAFVESVFGLPCLRLACSSSNMLESYAWSVSSTQPTPARESGMSGFDYTVTNLATTPQFVMLGRVGVWSPAGNRSYFVYDSPFG